MRRPDDHDVCMALRAGRLPDAAALVRAIERGLVDAGGLTVKGIALLDGIHQPVPKRIKQWEDGVRLPPRQDYPRRPRGRPRKQR